MPDSLDSFRELLQQSSATLSESSSPEEVNQALLRLLEATSTLVADRVTVPQFNSQEATGVRTLVFNVYHRLAKVLGRNTPEAVKADTKAFVMKHNSRMIFTPGRGRPGRGREASDPVKHVENVVTPMLDGDMLDHAFDINVYRFKEMWPLYNLFTLRRPGKTTQLADEEPLLKR